MILTKHRRKRFLLLALLLFLLSPVCGIAQDDSAARQEGSSSASPSYVTMNFKDVDLQVFIKFISELVGKNFLIDPNVRGTVTIISPQRVTVDEVYQVFLSVLEVNGFTTVDAGRVVKIIPTAAAKTKATETVVERRLGPRDDKIITQLLPLKFADASFLGRLLASLVERTGLLIPYPETNTIIVIDTQSNINRLVKIINELDVPGDEEISVFSIKHAKAEDLAKKILAVLQERRAAGAPAPQEVKILADERTNSLVALANPPQMARIKTLVERLDQRLVRSRENIHIYSLQNAVAENIAAVLAELPGKGTKDEKIQAPAISKDVHITADKATNSLVIIAEPEEYDILVEVIKRLDEPRAMVYVEALIMEVSATKAMDLGVEWRVGREFDGGFAAGEPGGVWFTGARGDTETASEIIATGTLPRGFVAGVIGRGITLGNITFPTIASFVRAVKTDSDFNIISTPQILTLDNEEAIIDVGQTIPFVTRVDLGDQVTSRAIQSFEYKDVGVTLKVIPQINDLGFIRLQVEQSVRAVISQTALGGTVLAPTTAYRTAMTSINVEAGETAVIGGLISTTIDRSRTQTPCLGNVPALGWLFKSTRDRDEKTNLMVFLVPHVVRGTDETREIYGIKREHMDTESEKARTLQEKEVIRQRLYE